MKMLKYNQNDTCKGATARKQWLLLILLLMVTGMAVGASNKGSAYEYVMNIDNSTLAVVDGNVVVAIKITAIQDVPASQSIVLAPELVDTTTQYKAELPLIFINSRNQQIYFERDLKNEYPGALALRKKNGRDLKIDYLRTVKYEPWMQNAVLKLKKLSCACNRQKARGEEILASLVKPEVKPVQIELFPVYRLPPADKSVKVREEKGSAYLCFVVNKWDILPDYMSNPAELQKIHNSVNVVKSDSDVSIRKMVIEGYASPEGNYPHNIMLSENRTNALKQYLLNSGIMRGISVEASGKGENWEGFIKYLRENTYLPERDQLLSIATSSLQPDEKERLMRTKHPTGYNYCLKNVFPKLRCTNYTVIYTVRPFTLEESERVFETRPINLNLNEIYKLADKYADDREKYYAIIRKAYMLYPEDTYINLTLACLAIKRGDADEAEEFMKKVKDCPEKTMDEGILAYMRGDMEKAVRLLKQAESQGLGQATRQLEEFAKLNPNK